MAIRLPLKTVLTLDDAGTSSIATGTSGAFTLPQDTDNVVLKLTASIIGGGVSAFLQTTDDGGTTYYDVARTSVISAGTDWITVPVAPAAAAVGSANASTLALGSASGLPILSQHGRVVLSYATAGTSNAAAKAEVKVNSQSATA